MPRTLFWTVTREDGTTRVVLRGEITESGDLAPLLDELPAGESVAFDLAGVKRVNSWGVRNWLKFVAGLKAHHPSFVLERCSVAIVNQLTLIPKFVGEGRLASIFVPYFCEPCDEEHARLLELKTGAASALAEPVACPTCGQPMVLDDVPSRYAALAKD